MEVCFDLLGMQTIQRIWEFNKLKDLNRLIILITLA
jgi:hypothetical protein